PSTDLFSSFLPDPAPTLIYTLSLHDALPIFARSFKVSAHQHFAHQADAKEHDTGQEEHHGDDHQRRMLLHDVAAGELVGKKVSRSEEHTSELQSRENLVCRLLLEKKKKQYRQ